MQKNTKVAPKGKSSAVVVPELNWVPPFSSRVVVGGGQRDKKPPARSVARGR